MHLLRVFCKVAILLAAGQASATGLVAAFSEEKARATALESIQAKYRVFVAGTMKSQSSREVERGALPSAIEVMLPAKIPIAVAFDAWIGSVKIGQCFLPDDSLVIVTSLSRSRLVGYVNWRYGYRGEPPRCLGRELPENNMCKTSRSANISPCEDGDLVMIEFDNYEDKGNLYSELFEALKASTRVK